MPVKGMSDFDKKRLALEIGKKPFKLVMGNLEKKLKHEDFSQIKASDLIDILMMVLVSLDVQCYVTISNSFKLETTHGVDIKKIIETHIGNLRNIINELYPTIKN